MCDLNPLLTAAQRGNGQNPADKTQGPEAQAISYGTNVILHDVAKELVITPEILMLSRILVDLYFLEAHTNADIDDSIDNVRKALVQSMVDHVRDMT